MSKQWDQRSTGEQAKIRDAGIAAQFADSIGPFSPWYRERLKEIGLKGADVKKLATMQRIAPTGERDLCPDGDPAGAAALVLRADETGWALHASGTDLRGGLLKRLRGGTSFRTAVEAATRPTSYHFGGVGLTFPIASTRNDLDLIARAGARMWRVLGLSSADVLVSAVPVEQRLDHVALSYAALAAGAPALAPGGDVGEVADTLGMLPATVLALPAHAAAAVLQDLGELPASVATILLVGGPTAEQRADAVALAGDRRVLGVWGPPDGRVLYAEDVAGGGYVTYPDLEVIELLDPDTGAVVDADGEVTVTQLGFRGSALVRWRTGTTVSGALRTGSVNGRTVPRLPSALDTSSLVPSVNLQGVSRAVDLRALSGVLAARIDLVAFRVDLGSSPRTGAEQLVIAIAPRDDADEARVATGVAADTRRATGARVTQIVIDSSLR